MKSAVSALCLIAAAIFLSSVSSQVHAQSSEPSSSGADATSCPGDANHDKIVDMTDYSLLIVSFFTSPPSNPDTDFNKDDHVDMSDYSLLVNNFFTICRDGNQTSTPTPTPTLQPTTVPSLSPTSTPTSASGPIRLHPDNPHYFIFNNQPTALITSAEHYGAVVNLDFGYDLYFDELQKNGFNYTRIFAGTYAEGPGGNVAGLDYNNTWAPKPERFSTPWKRGSTPGYKNGGNKFDLTQWDEAHFARLKDFIKKAEEHGIIVEVTLFCTMYSDAIWDLSPMRARNNINGIGTVGKTEVHSLANGSLMPIQEAYVEKMIRELNGFDNIFYEIINEPYVDTGATPEWQAKIADKIVAVETGLPKKHLIAQNIANERATITNPNPKVSFFNFHYAFPDAVTANFQLNTVIGLDETGRQGWREKDYRNQAWQFMLAGGGLYNMLDFSFTPDSEQGNYVVPDVTPGAGNATLRGHLKVMKDFIYSFHFIKMSPMRQIVKNISVSSMQYQVLSEPGVQYAVYFSYPSGSTQLNYAVELPAGSYKVEHVNTTNGSVMTTENFTHSGGNKSLSTPQLTDDIAVRIKKN